MKRTINIIHVDERMHLVEFVITNGVIAVSLKIINYPDRFKEFGLQLAEYPLQPDSTLFNFKATISYRGDTRLRGWAHYFDRFTIDVYPYKTNGEAALTVTLEDRKPQLLGNNVQFSILTKAICIVELGDKLSKWNPKIDKEFSWEAD
jgi:hypothetical protein